MKISKETRLIAKKTILEKLKENENLYIFAYGSLIWNPSFSFLNKIKVCLKDYERSFCQLNFKARGTDKTPGLVLALNKKTNSKCEGILYKVSTNKKNEVLDIIIKRELKRGSYIPNFVKTIDLKGKHYKSLTFIMDQKHPYYIPKLTIDEQAKIIGKAHGYLGSCLEYLKNTHISLIEEGIIDKYILNLYKKAQTYKTPTPLNALTIKTFKNK